MVAVTSRRAIDLDSDDFRHRLEAELKRPITLAELRLLSVVDRILTCEPVPAKRKVADESSSVLSS